MEILLRNLLEHNQTTKGGINIMAGYTKLFGSILASSIWSEPWQVRIVWITMLAMSDRDGLVEAAEPGIADLARVPLPECLEALQKLSAPDKYSRSQEKEGRRIIKVKGGWQIVNYESYRDKASAEELKEKTAARVKRWRQRHVTPCNGDVTPVTPGNDIAEAYAAPSAPATSASAPGATPPLPPPSEKPPEPSGNPESVGYLVQAFSFCKSPGAQAKRDQIEDLLRQKVTPEQIRAYSIPETYRTWDFFAIIKKIRADCTESHAAPRSGRKHEHSAVDVFPKTTPEGAEWKGASDEQTKTDQGDGPAA
jgi:hypothetical protein